MRCGECFEEELLIFVVFGHFWHVLSNFFQLPTHVGGFIYLMPNMHMYSVHGTEWSWKYFCVHFDRGMYTVSPS